MKVLRLHDQRELRLHDEAQPEPVAGRALVRVKAVGVCESDLHRFSEGGTRIASSSRYMFELTTSNHGRRT